MSSMYLSIIVLGIAIFGLSIGVIFNNKPLSGSCGGNPDGSCVVCGGDNSKCEEKILDGNQT